MKKKIVATVMAMCLALAFTGCGKKNDDGTTESTGNADVTPQAEIVQMVNTDLPGIASERDSAVSIYNKYFEDGADLDSQTWRDQLENDALKSYESYLSKLDALTYQNAEVQTLKDLYQKSAESQKEAISNVVEAIKAVDTEKLDDAQQSIDDSKTYLKMYEDSLKDACTKYGIEIVGDFQTKDMVDASAVKKETKKASSTDASPTDASASDAAKSASSTDAE